MDIGKLTEAEKALNQKHRKRALRCSSLLYKFSTDAIKEELARYVARTEGAYMSWKSNGVGALMESVKYRRCNWRSAEIKKMDWHGV